MVVGTESRVQLCVYETVDQMRNMPRGMRTESADIYCCRNKKEDVTISTGRPQIEAQRHCQTLVGNLRLVRRSFGHGLCAIPSSIV